MVHWPRSLSAGTAALQPIAPGDAGFVPDIEARLEKAVADKRIWNPHGLIVVRNDRLVLERYFEGEDEARNVGKISHVTFKPDTMHDLRSCSKKHRRFAVRRRVATGESAATRSAAVLCAS
jgi:hypothetical protein